MQRSSLVHTFMGDPWLRPANIKTNLVLKTL